MAETAIPRDGGHRPVDVLSAGVAGPRPSPTPRAIPVLFAVLLASSGLSACSPDVEPADTGAASGRAGGIAPLVAALSARWPDGGPDAGSDNRSGDDRAVDTPRWPRDLAFHPGARAESIELLAILETVAPAGEARRDVPRATVVAVRRFDRLGVPLPDDAPVPGGDDFRFRDVVRSSALTTTGGTTTGGTTAGGTTAGGTTMAGASAGTASTVRSDAVERATLGLAGTDERQLFVRDAMIERMRASREDPGRDIGRDPAVPVCAGSGHVVSATDSTLYFSRRGCPRATTIDSLVVATDATLDVQGTVAVDGEPTVVAGRGWVRRVWGEPPPAGGAVVFDRLLLEVDGIGLIDAARSKRRSGRGPSFTTAGVGADTLDDIVWLDGAGADAGGDRDAAADTRDGREVPGGWRLRAPSRGLDVVLAPLLDMPVTDDVSGRAWRGAVLASGSHSGIGFVEFLPIGADGDVAVARAVRP